MFVLIEALVMVAIRKLIKILFISKEKWSLHIDISHQINDITSIVISKNIKMNYIFIALPFFYRCFLDVQIVHWRFTGFNNPNKDDQTELKKIFGSTTVSRKRQNEKWVVQSKTTVLHPKANNQRSKKRLNQHRNKMKPNRKTFTPIRDFSLKDFHWFSS